MICINRVQTDWMRRDVRQKATAAMPWARTAKRGDGGDVPGLEGR